MVLQATDSTIATLRELKDMGIKITLDDFGTGVYSLAYLKHFPIDMLKIDKSFVQNALTNPTDAAIVMAMITLARGLKIKTIPEGIETEEQLAFFKQQQCEEIQGFLFSKPVPAEEFEEMLVQDRRLKCQME